MFVAQSPLGTSFSHSGLKKNPEMTVDEALFYLTQNNEEKLVEATSCLQRTFFQGSGWKKKV